MANSGSSRHADSKSKKRRELNKIKDNRSGLQHALHGIAYQLKLGIVVCLANVERSMNPANKFNFTFHAESRGDSETRNHERDVAIDKFDDIVYIFQDGDKTGTLKIQAKHKLDPSSCKYEQRACDAEGVIENQATNQLKSRRSKITPIDFIPQKQDNENKKTNDGKKGKNPFALDEYFTSFNHQFIKDQQKSHIKGYIICTNADIDDDAKVMWKPTDASITRDSPTPLDYYILSLLDKTGGKCYQLKTHYKSAMLARLLINAIDSNIRKISWQRPLLKEYRAAILSIIEQDDMDKDSQSDTSLFKFKNSFIDSSVSNSKPGYDTLRKEFEEQYRQEFKIEGYVWDDVKRKRIHVAEGFLDDGKNKYSSSDSFPGYNEEESFKPFCERFRLVCGTNNEQELDDVIGELWRSLHFNDSLSVGGWKRCGEEDLAIERLFKSNFDCLKDPSTYPLRPENIKKDLEKIANILAQIKLKGISDKLRKKVLGSPFRINHDSLKDSHLYKQVEFERFLLVETYDIQFGATVLSDILALQGKEPIFFDDSDFFSNYKKEQNFFCSLLQHSSFIIICDEKNPVPTYMLYPKPDYGKQILLIKKTNSVPTNVGCFRICDLTEESWNLFLSEDISIYTTTISAANIFQNNFHEHFIEEAIKLLDWGKQMEENNQIIQKYRSIETTYAHRCWIDAKNTMKAGDLSSLERYNISSNLRNINDLQGGKMSFREIVQRIMRSLVFNIFFPNAYNPESELQRLVGDTAKRVLILLGEAGSGKSTSLTWLTWHLLKRYPSSWVVRCNLSDHCTDFKAFVQYTRNNADRIIDDNEALRMLYKVIHSSLQLEREIIEKCAQCLVFLDGEARVNEYLMKHYGLSLNNSIQMLVFQEKFNAGEIMLLMDGFDEIAPSYKEVVLQILSLFSKFKGVRKLYITSRPYGLKDELKNAFKEAPIFVLKPLSLQEKGSMLFNMMKEKWQDRNVDDEEISNFLKALCFTLLYHLDEMSDIPLNLMISVDILEQSVNQYVNIPSKKIDLKLFKDIERIFKPYFMVEEFVKIKILNLLYDKNDIDRKVADKPLEMERLEKEMDEVKLKHGLVALWVLFDNRELGDILSKTEIYEAEDYLKEIDEAKEKTGIINGLKDSVPMFMHRTFAEYLAAWWIVKRQIEVNQQGQIKIFHEESFRGRTELRKYVDTILAIGHPLHLAIIDKDWKTVKTLLSEDPKVYNEKDDGNRTPLHLLICYWNSTCNDLLHYLPKSIESDIINTKEKIFSRTALGHAFERETSEMIYYLLHHGASIHVDAQYEKIVSFENVDFHIITRYAKHVMGFLSQQAIVYDSNDDCKTMKLLCDKVAAYMICKNGYDEKIEKKLYLIKIAIEEDSVWMLESIMNLNSILDKTPQMTQTITKRFFDCALRNASIKGNIFIVKLFVEKYGLWLNDDDLWRCIVQSAVFNYKNEFKWFIDVYFSGMRIKKFQPCSIRNEEGGHFIKKKYSIKEIEAFYECKKTILRNIPTEIMIDQNILPVLIICIVSVRPSMLKYLKESTFMNLSADIVYHLARMVHRLLSTHLNLHNYRNKLIYKTAPSFAPIKTYQTYECLLDQASNISDVDANTMFPRAMVSNLFEFLKCVIERYNIDLVAVENSYGWNAFHLCVSSPCSDDEDDVETRIQLFRSMLNRMEMDCFDIFDQNGRSVFHLAFENQHYQIVRYIVARKLGINDLNEINSVGVDAIPHLVFCCDAIHEISKSVNKGRCFDEVLCMLTEQIAKISLDNHYESSHQQNAGYFLLQKYAEDWYQTAMNCKSLFLMYYLHREFRCMIPSSVEDADWILWIAESMKSSSIELFKWIVSQYCVVHHIILPKETNTMKDIRYKHNNSDASRHGSWISLNLRELVLQVDAILSNYLLKDELCIIKLIVVSVCLRHKSAIRYLCETFEVDIDQKILFDIMKIVHHVTNQCKFDEFHFDRIYKYLIVRCSNFYEKDDQGRNILHVAAQSGPNCLIRSLFNHNMIQATIINVQNGWNVLHYYASRPAGKGCYTKDAHLLRYMFELLLKNDEHTIEAMAQSRETKIKQLCFNRNDGIKSVADVAAESGNLDIIECIIQLCLRIDTIDKHKIWNLDECSSFKECYDLLNEIAVPLSFNGKSEKLLDKIAKPIDSYSLENIKNKTGAENADHDHLEDACRSAVKYRSISTLEHLIKAYDHQMNQSLATSTDRELVACMIKCIRRNRTNLFKVLLGHYCALQGIQHTAKVEKANECQEKEVECDASNPESEYDSHVVSEANFEREVWSVINQTSHEESVNSDHLQLLILSVAYERFEMTKYVVQMFQLKVNKTLILSSLKAVGKKKTGYNTQDRIALFKYLVTVSEGNPNLLHLCVQAREDDMLYYLLADQDPTEVDSENGWNTGHYCVSDKMNNANSSNAFLVYARLMDYPNMDFFGVHDRKGRSILHLAMENGHTDIVESLSNHDLCDDFVSTVQCGELLEKLEKRINEFQRIQALLPESRDYQDILQKMIERKHNLIQLLKR